MANSLMSFAFGTLAALFPIANPIGALPVFYSLTVADSPRYRIRQAQRTTLNVVGVLVVFLLAGRLILNFLGLSLGVLQIAGGLIVGHTAWQMVTSRQRITPEEHTAAADKEDVSFTPMAIPIISGPGAIGVVISQATRANSWSDYAGCLLGVLALGVVLYGCLILGEPLVERMGTTGLGAFNRILGFLILAIAVQLVADGTLALLKPVLP